MELSSSSLRVHPYGTCDIAAVAPSMTNKKLGMRALRHESPTISVLLPVYNAYTYLSKAIESILAQSYSDFELIIVNDGSTDGSREIIDFYAQADMRIRVVNQENQGQGAALNAGLTLVQGEFVARMDADDIALPQRFERQLLYLRQNPGIGVLGCSCQVIDSAGAILPHQPLFPNTGSIMLKWLMHFGSPIPHPAAMVRTEVLQGSGGYQTGIVAEDYELWLRLSHTTLFDNLSEPLLLYRRHAQSITGSGEQQVLENAAHARRAYLQQVYGLEISQQQSIALQTCLTESPTQALALTRIVQQLWREFNRRHPAVARSEYVRMHKLYLKRIYLIWESRNQAYILLRFMEWQDVKRLAISGPLALLNKLRYVAQP